MKQKIIIGITAAVFVAALLLTCLMLRPSDSTLVEIVQDGTVLRTIDLTHAENQSFRIDAANGSYNIVTIADGKICVSEAGCPDQTCVHMGALKSDSMPIVCLPNKLIVRFAE